MAIGNKTPKKWNKIAIAELIPDMNINNSLCFWELKYFEYKNNEMHPKRRTNISERITREEEVKFESKSNNKTTNSGNAAAFLYIFLTNKYITTSEKILAKSGSNRNVTISSPNIVIHVRINWNRSGVYQKV